MHFPHQIIAVLPHVARIARKTPPGLHKYPWVYVLCCGFGFDCQCVAHATSPPWLKATSNTLAFLIGCPNVGVHARHGTSRVRFL